jgi:hypothetical protein
MTVCQYRICGTISRLTKDIGTIFNIRSSSSSLHSSKRSTKRDWRYKQDGYGQSQFILETIIPLVILIISASVWASSRHIVVLELTLLQPLLLRIDNLKSESVNLIGRQSRERETFRNVHRYIFPENISGRTISISIYSVLIPIGLLQIK